MEDALGQRIRASLPAIAGLRHELHAHPEIRFQERWTSDRIARFLEEAGIPHTRGHVKGTGILAVVRGEKEPGKTILLRADMDALELQEETGVPYASQIPGRMHACGHDGHSAMLCAAAQALHGVRDTFSGTVKCFFQPAEEQASGGYYVGEEGLLDDVDAAFALHAWPTVPVGKLGLREGPTMASADFFRIEVRGKGGHGAHPGSTIDPILAAAHLVTALQSIVSREIDPWDPAVVTVAQIHGGSSSNIIPDTAWIEGTSRALRPETRIRLRDAIARVADQTARTFRASAETTFGTPESSRGYPALFNDPAMCALARETAEACLGPDAVLDIPQPSMASEDFAYYLEHVPGAMLFLGNATGAVEDSPSLHTSRFDFNDEALAPGITFLTHLSLRFLA